MPIYLYRCEECGEVFDELRAISDNDAPALCACGSRNTRRKLATFFHPRSGLSELEEDRSSSNGSVATGSTGMFFDKSENVDISNCRFEGLETPFRIRDSSVRLRGNRSRGSRNRLVVEGDSYVRSEGNDYG